MTNESIYHDTLMGHYGNSLNEDRERKQAEASGVTIIVSDGSAQRYAARDCVAVCGVCGGKYYPAGGECTHEQLTDTWRQAEERDGRSCLPQGGQTMDDQRRQAERKSNRQLARLNAVGYCDVCGGKYYPAGGPCIHEHPARRQASSGPVCCLSCGSVWRPGHVCLAQAAPVCRWCGRPQADPLTVYDVEFIGTWWKMAQTHAPDCQWIRTRGGQIESLQEEQSE